MVDNNIIGIVIVCTFCFMLGAIAHKYYPYTEPEQTLEEREYISTRLAFNDDTNHTVNGVWFPESTLCVRLNRENKEALYNTVCHELLHDIINNNDNCGNTTCKEHYCKGLRGDE